jgi:hypothetical protein
MGADPAGDPVDVPTQLAVALITLVGSAGFASSVAQLTRAARLRRRIERHTELAKSFPLDSVPARSLTMTARIAAVELSARTCVVLAPIVIFLSLSFGALMLVLVLLLVVTLSSTVPPVATIVLLYAALLLVAFVAFYPLVPLSAQRAKMELKLLAEPAFLDEAMTGDARRVISLDRSLFENK